MILAPADRQRIADAYRERVGNLSLPSSATVDDVCTNLVLAIPALLETLSNYDARLRYIIDTHRIDTEDCEDAIVAIRRHIAALEARLTEDPCP